MICFIQPSLESILAHITSCVVCEGGEAGHAPVNIDRPPQATTKGRQYICTCHHFLLTLSPMSSVLVSTQLLDQSTFRLTLPYTYLLETDFQCFTLSLTFTSTLRPLGRSSIICSFHSLALKGTVEGQGVKYLTDSSWRAWDVVIRLWGVQSCIPIHTFVFHIYIDVDFHL